MIEIAQLTEDVIARKSPSSAKNYLATLRRLSQFLHDADSFDINEITPEFLTDFVRFLLAEGMQPTSVALYLKCLRAILRPFIPDRTLFKKIFANVESRTLPSQRSLNLREFRSLLRADLSSYPLLDKTRRLLLKGVLSGGAPLSPLPANYATSLLALSTLLRLPSTLTPDSPLEIWIQCARDLSIPPARIAAAAGAENDFIRQARDTNLTLSPEEILQIRDEIADAVCDRDLSWYVVRAYPSTTPAEIAALLADPHESPFRNDPLRTFIPPPATAAEERLPLRVRRKAQIAPTLLKGDGKTYSAPSAMRRSNSSRPTLMDRMLFIECNPTTALRIRQYLYGKAYTYCYADSPLPARIPSSEMRLFMLMAEVAPETLSYHFPDATDAPLPASLEEGRKARIIAGDIAYGQEVTILKSPLPGHHRIRVAFTALNGAQITADLPSPYLSPLR